MSISVLNTDAGLSGKTVVNAEDTQTVTGAKTFDRDPNPPFAVSSGSAVVTNLDADMVDGYEGSELGVLAENETVSGNWTFSGTVTTSGVVTGTGQLRCSLIHGAAQVLTTSTWTSMLFDTEEFDVGSLHDTATNTSRVTIPSGGDGVYLVIGVVVFSTNNVGNRATRILKNGTTETGSQTIHTSFATQPTVVTCTQLISLVATDYIELQGWHSVGSDLSTGSATDSAANRLYVIKLW